MKKNKISLLLLVATLAIGLSAATTGNLTLTGVVNGVLDITVTPEAAATGLDLVTSQTDLKVATINEKSNKSSGYTVMLESANAKSASSATPTLNSISGNGDSLSYSLKYNGSAVTFTNGVATVTDSTATTSATGVNKDLLISYVGDNSLSEGSYEDTLTFTIAAK